MSVCLRFLKFAVSLILNTGAGFFVLLLGMIFFFSVITLGLLCFKKKTKPACVSLKPNMGFYFKMCFFFILATIGSSYI